MQQAAGRSRWLGWSGGTPRDSQPSGDGASGTAGGTTPSAGSSAIALRLLRCDKGVLLLLALTQAGLECWQVWALLNGTAGMPRALASCSEGLFAASTRQGCAAAAGANAMPGGAGRCSPCRM